MKKRQKENRISQDEQVSWPLDVDLGNWTPARRRFSLFFNIIFCMSVNWYEKNAHITFCSYHHAHKAAYFFMYVWTCIMQCSLCNNFQHVYTHTEKGKKWSILCTWHRHTHTHTRERVREIIRLKCRHWKNI